MIGPKKTLWLIINKSYDYRLFLYRSHLPLKDYIQHGLRNASGPQRDQSHCDETVSVPSAPNVLAVPCGHRVVVLQHPPQLQTHSGGGKGGVSREVKAEPSSRRADREAVRLSAQNRPKGSLN